MIIVKYLTELKKKQVVAYISSAEFERKVKNMETFKETAAKIKTQANNKPSMDEKRAIYTYHEQSKLDQLEINNTYNERDIYLKLAMK